VPEALCCAGGRGVRIPSRAFRESFLGINGAQEAAGAEASRYRGPVQDARMQMHGDRSSYRESDLCRVRKSE